MWDYVACTAFWVVFTLMIYALGNVLIRNEEGQAVKFVAGYLSYSFFVAIGGIIIQFLNISWNVFAVYMVLLLVGIITVILVSKKKSGKIFSNTLNEFVSCYWFIFALTAFLCVVLLFYFRSFWYGNHLDDGYYLTKVATVAHDGGDYKKNYAVGMGNWTGASYLINTWELEASFFVNVLRVTPSVFLRFFQSGFNYFVFFNCSMAFGEKIVVGLKREKIDTKVLQYVGGVFLVFFVYYVYMQDTKFFFLRDVFHLNTAMYYGASIAKLTVVMCMLLFFINEEFIGWKMVIGVVGISLVMMSKSSIVLPVLVIVILSSCITWLFESHDKRMKIMAAIIIIVTIGVGILLPGNSGSQNEVYTYVHLMIKSPVIWVCMIIFLVSFRLRERVVYRLNAIMIISGILIVVPEINDIFETFAVYGFVAGRAWSMWIYTFVVMCAFYSFIILNKVLKKRILKWGYIFIALGMSALVLHGFETDGKELYVTDQMPAKTSLKDDIQILIHNRKFLPNATIELGEELEKTSEKTGEQLYVLSPRWAVVNDAAHSLSIQLRTVAPSVISVSAVERYEVDKNCELYGYDQSKYDEFTYDPNAQTLDALEVEIEKYNINCIVVQNENCGEYLEKIGFREEKTIAQGTYLVWYKLAEE